MIRALIAMALLAPVAAHADELDTRYSLAAALGASYVTDRSMDFVSRSDASTIGDLRLGWAPGWNGRRIELQLGYTGTSSSDTTFGTIDTELAVKTLQLGAAYRRPIVGPLDVYGRLAGLFDFDTLTLSGGSDTLPIAQTTHTLGLLGAAGAEVVALKSGRAQVGFFVELGYAYRFAPARFDKLAPDVGDAKPAPVAFTPVNAGEINLSGIQWRLGAALRF